MQAAGDALLAQNLNEQSPNFPMISTLRILICLLGFTASLMADEATIAATELPKPVAAAILQHYPKAIIISAEKKGSVAETVYVVRFKILETVRIGEVTSDGILKKIEEPTK